MQCAGFSNTKCRPQGLLAAERHTWFGKFPNSTISARAENIVPYRVPYWSAVTPGTCAAKRERERNRRREEKSHIRHDPLGSTQPTQEVTRLRGKSFFFWGPTELCCYGLMDAAAAARFVQSLSQKKSGKMVGSSSMFRLCYDLIYNGADALPYPNTLTLTP